MTGTIGGAVLRAPGRATTSGFGRATTRTFGRATTTALTSLVCALLVPAVGRAAPRPVASRPTDGALELEAIRIPSGLSAERFGAFVRGLQSVPRLRVQSEPELQAQLTREAAPAANPSGADGDRQLVDQAARRYRELEFAEAVALANDAEQKLASSWSSRADVQAIYQARVWRGLAQLALGKVAPAQQAFRDAATLSPDKQPESALFPPKAAKLYLQERTAVRSTSIDVSIDSEPSQATVLVDGERRGETPLRLALGTGRHLVRVEAFGYEPELRELPVDARGPAPALKVALRLAGRARLAAQLSDSGVARSDMLDRPAAVALGAFLGSRRLLLVGRQRAVLYELSSLGTPAGLPVNYRLGDCATNEAARQAGVALGSQLAESQPTTGTGEAADSFAAGGSASSNLALSPSSPVAAPPQSGATGGLSERDPAAPPPRATHWYRSWWFYTALGVVAAGAIVGVVAYEHSSDGTTDLGITGVRPIR